MELSIIIPIYNTPTDKLKWCFDGIARLEGIRYECILVDDGSDEQTANYCKHHSDNHPWFKYIRKENGGVSSARNVGIRNAKAKYVCFVDSDDIIIPEAFGTICKSLSSGEVDLLFTDLMVTYRKSAEYWRAFDKPGMIQYEEAVARLSRDGTLNGPYCKFIKNEFLQRTEVRFDESMILGEDAVFLLKLLQKRPTMWYCNIVSYRYYRAPETGKNRFRKNPRQVINDLLTNKKLLMEEVEQANYDKGTKEDLIRKLEERLVFGLFGYAADGADFNLLSAPIKEIFTSAISMVKKDVVPQMSSGIRIRYLVLARGQWALLTWAAKLRRIYWKAQGICQACNFGDSTRVFEDYS